MGASNGGIAIKMDTTQIDIEKVVQDLFGKEYERCSDYCDTRRKGCIYVTKEANVLTLVNTELADTFFQNQHIDSVSKYVNYFNTPELIFAFEQYDSGGTYSYSLIYNGVLRRQFRSLSYETTIDFGEFEEIELDWKDGKICKFDLGDGEFEITYTNRKNRLQCDAINLPQMILQQLLFEKLGFDNDESKIIDKAFFKLVEA